MTKSTINSKATSTYELESVSDSDLRFYAQYYKTNGHTFNADWLNAVALTMEDRDYTLDELQIKAGTLTIRLIMEALKMYNFFILVKIDGGIKDGESVLTKATTVKTKRQAMLIAQEMLFSDENAYI